MKTLLKVLGGIILVVVLLMLVIGKSYHYEKTIVIDASPEKVYTHISSSKAFNEWNPWLDLDPNIKIEYKGTQGEVGDEYCWLSENENTGEGCHKILELMPNKGVKTQMTFKKPFENVSYSKIVLEEQGGKTKVTWDMDTELPYPMNLMKLMMDGNMDESYGKGLERLKALSEK